MNDIGHRQLPARAYCVLILFCALLIYLFGAGAGIARADEPTPVPTSSTGAATVTATIVKTGANLRAGPGTNYPRIGGAKAGQVIEIVARNPAGDWYQLANGAWIFGSLVANAPVVPVAKNIVTSPAATPSAIPSTPTTAATNSPQQVIVKVRSNANLRAGPGTDQPKVGAAKAGQSLTIIAQDPTGDWYLTAAGAWIFGELLDSAPTVSVAADIPVSPAVTAASLGASKVPAVADSGTGARNARQGTVAALSRGLPNTNSLESLQNSERAGKLSPTAVIDGRSWLSGNLYAAHL